MPRNASWVSSSVEKQIDLKYVPYTLHVNLCQRARFTHACVVHQNINGKGLDELSVRFQGDVKLQNLEVNALVLRLVYKCFCLGLRLGGGQHAVPSCGQGKRRVFANARPSTCDQYGFSHVT
jgi:glutamate dehydrogenase/leucine dehydrogenase